MGGELEVEAWMRVGGVFVEVLVFGLGRGCVEGGVAEVGEVIVGIEIEGKTEGVWVERVMAESGIFITGRLLS